MHWVLPENVQKHCTLLLSRKGFLPSAAAQTTLEAFFFCGCFSWRLSCRFRPARKVSKERGLYFRMGQMVQNRRHLYVWLERLAPLSLRHWASPAAAAPGFFLGKMLDRKMLNFVTAPAKSAWLFNCIRWEICPSTCTNWAPCERPSQTGTCCQQSSKPKGFLKDATMRADSFLSPFFFPFGVSVALRQDIKWWRANICQAARNRLVLLGMALRYFFCFLNLSVTFDWCFAVSLTQGTLQCELRGNFTDT